MKYEGLRVGVIVRNSTTAQVGNWRSIEQEGAAEARILEGGGIPVLYDEQGTSGRSLLKRPVARQLLEDLSAKRLDAIYAYDISRLTRDEYGADAGTIARFLADNRALLITEKQDFRLWQNDELRTFRILAAISGGEIGDISSRMQAGVMSRARHEVFLRAVPIGYATEVIEVPIRGRHATRLSRKPIKDPAMALMMERFIECLRKHVSTGDLVKEMNKLGLGPVTQKNRHDGEVHAWETRHVHRMLDNPLYYGIWIFGRTTDRIEKIQHSAPELAYWTRADALEWSRKFKCKTRAAKNFTHDNALRGWLVCATCGARLVASGQKGYVCPRFVKTTLPVGSCAQRLQIGHAKAMALLRGLVPLALAEWQEMDGVLAQPKTEPDTRLDFARHEMDSLVADWYAPDSPRPVPRAILVRMSELENEIVRLENEAADARIRTEISGQARAAIDAMKADPLASYDQLQEPVQVEFLRLLLSDVTIEWTGSFGKNKKYGVVSYVNALTQLAGTLPWTLASKLSMLFHGTGRSGPSRPEATPRAAGQSLHMYGPVIAGSSPAFAQATGAA